MGRKPGKMYRYVRGQSYQQRKYMGGVPQSRITQFDQGNLKAKFPITMVLIVEEKCQIRHIALEAARIAANRYLQRVAGTINYHLKIRVYPHEVLRENKQATGAGADRISQGMRRSFGKAIGTAARVLPGQKIMTLKTNKQNFKACKEAFRRARMKLPSPMRVVIEEGGHLVN